MLYLLFFDERGLRKWREFPRILLISPFPTCELACYSCNLNKLRVSRVFLDIYISFSFSSLITRRLKMVILKLINVTYELHSQQLLMAIKKILSWNAFTSTHIIQQFLVLCFQQSFIVMAAFDNKLLAG